MEIVEEDTFLLVEDIVQIREDMGCEYFVVIKVIVNQD